MEITIEQARRVLEVVDAGLCRGVGISTPGHMCVEAAVCYAFGEPHGDNPTCVHYVLRDYKIWLNDFYTTLSLVERAKGLRSVALLQLGSKNNFDAEVFTSLLERKIRENILAAFKDMNSPSNAQKVLIGRMNADNVFDKMCAHNSCFMSHRYFDRLTDVGRNDVLLSTNLLGHVLRSNEVCKPMTAVEHFYFMCKDLEDILIEMKVPGIQWLPLLEEVKDGTVTH